MSKTKLFAVIALVLALAAIGAMFLPLLDAGFFSVNYFDTAMESFENLDSVNGIVTFAFATKSSMEAGAAVATVSFAYENQYVKTSLEVSALERN